MATFFKPSPSILCPSSSIWTDLSLKRVDASRSVRPAHLSDPSFPNGAAVEVAIEARTESRTLVAVGCFTEEKAKQLRRKTAEGYAFHDVMYHSAIASRLATDVSCPSRFE